MKIICHWFTVNIDDLHFSHKTIAAVVLGETCYTAKSYVLNQKWNQSDPDLYPETQRNFLATGLIPNCKSDLYQFCSSVSVQQKQP